MADFAAEQGLTVKDKLHEEFNADGLPAAGRIKAYAASKPASEPGDWEGTEPDLKALRNGYLHMSSKNAAVAMEMRTQVDQQGKHRPHRRLIRDTD